MTSKRRKGAKLIHWLLMLQRVVIHPAEHWPFVFVARPTGQVDSGHFPAWSFNGVVWLRSTKFKASRRWSFPCLHIWKWWWLHERFIDNFVSGSRSIRLILPPSIEILDSFTSDLKPDKLRVILSVDLTSYSNYTIKLNWLTGVHICSKMTQRIFQVSQVIFVSCTGSSDSSLKYVNLF